MLKEVLLSITLTIILCLIYLVIVNDMIYINKKTINQKNLPDSFNNYKIVLIADMHDKYFDGSHMRLVDAISAQNPDLVVFSGDMHNKDGDDEKFFSFCSALAKKFPVYYTEGNHEKDMYSNGYKEYIKKLSETGVVLINDYTVKLKNGNDYINLTGVGWSNLENPILNYDENTVNLLICHNPLLFDEFFDKTDLMLSGHIHGGILQIPGVGGVFSPGAGVSFLKRWSKKFFFPKYYKGIYEQDGRYLAVTVGIGCSVVPFRLIPAEIMVINLKKT